MYFIFVVGFFVGFFIFLFFYFLIFVNKYIFVFVVVVSDVLSPTDRQFPSTPQVKGLCEITRRDQNQQCNYLPVCTSLSTCFPPPRVVSAESLPGEAINV